MNKLNLHFIAFRIGYSTRCVGCDSRMFLCRTHPINCMFLSSNSHSASINGLKARFDAGNLAVFNCTCLEAAPDLEEAMTYKFTNGQPANGNPLDLLASHTKSCIIGPQQYASSWLLNDEHRSCHPASGSAERTLFPLLQLHWGSPGVQTSQSSVV